MEPANARAHPVKGRDVRARAVSSEREKEGGIHPPPTHPPKADTQTTHTIHTWRVLFEGKGGGRGHGTCQQLHVHRLIRLLANLFPPFFSRGEKWPARYPMRRCTRDTKKKTLEAQHTVLSPFFYLFSAHHELQAGSATCSRPPSFCLSASLYLPPPTLITWKKRYHDTIGTLPIRGKKENEKKRYKETTGQTQEKEKVKKKKKKRREMKRKQRTKNATKPQVQRKDINPPPTPPPHHTPHPYPFTPSNCSFVPQGQSRPAG